jgi:site-specific DNA recombinase
MRLSVPVLLPVELGASPATPAGVQPDQAEAAVVAEMYDWYADEAHSLFGLARTCAKSAKTPH